MVVAVVVVLSRAEAERPGEQLRVEMPPGATCHMAAIRQEQVRAVMVQAFPGRHVAGLPRVAQVVSALRRVEPLEGWAQAAAVVVSEAAREAPRAPDNLEARQRALPIRVR